MINHKTSDLNERKLSLDSSKSFIVQAPAGSGKTSLLVQRYLQLLSHVNAPEEIVAITFTRKAAFEMRDRIINTLKDSSKKIPTEDQHKITTQKLAQKALKQNESKNWNILQNPNRLRIQTIDAFCYYLVNSSPIFTQINPNFQIIQNQEAEACYQKASREVLENINNPQYTHHLENLLLHLGNDWERLENLFVTMLQSREQWLPHIVGLKNIKKLRPKMEEALQEISQENIERAISFLPENLHQELIELLKFSKDNYEEPPSFLYEIEIKKTRSTSLTTLKGIASILLTKEFSWRKQITKKQGFPTLDTKHPKDKRQLFKSMKTRMEQLLKEFSSHEDLRLSLENLLLSPPPHYQDQQWQIIESLLELLPLLAAHLKVIFNENTITDYAEISMAALQALGNEEEPSDFALNLDYRLQHLLIDEFQDTSLSHFKLIEKLTTAWQPDDGRTIFIVGDPMQSIYRFRDAEVGLFLRVQQEGINNLILKSINLNTNFRSCKNIVDWINNNFPKIMPQFPDISLGAVPFKEANATTLIPETKVNITLLKNAQINDEANALATTIKKLSKKYPEDTIAILVKARTHLKTIIPCLNQTKLNYQAFELETLQENLVIRDIFSLTRTLFDLADRIAWLAILRAPWCGLKLEDLYQIANGKNELIWDNICSHQNLNLTKDAEARLEKFQKKLLPIIQQRGRLSWQELIEKAWLIIGGPATINNEIELEYAQAYLELLKEPLDISLIEKKLNSLYTPPLNAKTKIQIMTIHKAKGLEFDHVIIPGVNQAAKTDDNKLISWFERPKLHRGSNLILASIPASGDNEDSVHNYLKRVEQKKSFYETGRLLYVAMTRAKKTVHIFGNIKNNIQTKTFLEQLKPCFNENWVIDETSKVITTSTHKQSEPAISRLKTNWQSPLTVEMPSGNNSPTWELFDDQKAIIGTVIHHILCQISQSNLDDWQNDYVTEQQPYWQKLLRQTGYLDLEHGLKIIKQAITSTLKDKRGRWILTNHQNAESEYEIINDDKHLIIDRTFIDEDGVRWIIDYKTSQPQQQNIEEFLIQEKAKYADQLQQYKKAMQKLEPTRIIKLSLYFPSCSGWVEI